MYKVKMALVVILAYMKTNIKRLWLTDTDNSFLAAEWRDTDQAWIIRAHPCDLIKDGEQYYYMHIFTAHSQIIVQLAAPYCFMRFNWTNCHTAQKIHSRPADGKISWNEN